MLKNNEWKLKENMRKEEIKVFGKKEEPLHHLYLLTLYAVELTKMSLSSFKID